MRMCFRIESQNKDTRLSYHLNMVIQGICANSPEADSSLAAGGKASSTDADRAMAELLLVGISLAVCL